MAILERWSVRTLRERMNTLLFERSALSSKPEATIQAELEHLRETQQLTPDLVFRNPYILDFLSLPPQHSERNLEDAILRDIEKFLLEMGAGFTFVEYLTQLPSLELLRQRLHRVIELAREQQKN
jgi:predicted nuclease of restriction endonuclease-like (RecB) superfamily